MFPVDARGLTTFPALRWEYWFYPPSLANLARSNQPILPNRRILPYRTQEANLTPDGRQHHALPAWLRLACRQGRSMLRVYPDPFVPGD